MKLPAKTTRRRARAFSLVETSVALGLFSLLIMPVLGLITAGVTQSAAAIDQSALHAVRDSLRLRLTNQPDWPVASSAVDWSADVSFSRDGSFLTPDDESAIFVTVRMSASPAASYPSDFLEAVRCEFLNPRDDSSITSCVIQRHRQP